MSAALDGLDWEERRGTEQPCLCAEVLIIVRQETSNIRESRLYIRSLTLQRFVCFTHTEVSLCHPTEEKRPSQNVNLLLGDNGSGKTAFLKGLALCGLVGVLPDSGLVPRNLVRAVSEDQEDGFLEATFEIEHQGGIAQDEAVAGVVVFDQSGRQAVQPWYNDDAYPSKNLANLWLLYQTHKIGRLPSELFEVFKDRFQVFEQWMEVWEQDPSSFFMLGYGATRRVDASEVFDPQTLLKRRSLRYQRVAGLFEDYIALIPLHGWLPRLKPKRRKTIIELIAGLLPDEISFRGEKEGYEYLFELDGIEVPFDALSDGYKGYIALVSDMVYHMNHVMPKGDIRELPGVVLIDEIDSHLHPGWQRRVVPKLASSFPKLQFVMTTHSPIVAGTVKSENILLMEMEPEGETGRKHCVPKRLEENVFGMSADQILVSSYFGLDTSRSTESTLERREIMQQALEGDSDAALNFLKSLIPDQKS